MSPAAMRLWTLRQRRTKNRQPILYGDGHRLYSWEGHECQPFVPPSGFRSRGGTNTTASSGASWVTFVSPWRYWS